MKKTILYLILLIVIVVGVLYLLKNPNNSALNLVTDYKNATYKIDGKNVALINGVAEAESIPGSATKTVTKYFGNEVKKDLNGDGREDIAFILTQDPGGSGEFYYVVSALNMETGYIGSDAVLLGDRIAPQTTESGPGNSIIVNYMVRAQGEPMTAQPSVGKSIQLILDPETMQFGEVAMNFEGEADPSRMNLLMKTWKWVRTESKDGKKVEPKKDVFNLTFKADGTFSASTDCNSVGGKYMSTKSAITFSDTLSTLMFCEGSQESLFQPIVQGANDYEFTSKGELVIHLKSDGGKAYFK